MKPSKTPTPEMILAAETLCLAMAHRDTVSPEIIGTEMQALQEGQYRVDSKFGAEITGLLITDPNRSYLMSDENFEVYRKRCIELQKIAGYEIVDDKCPKLMAESLVSDAKKALIVAVFPITNITPHKLLCLGLAKYNDFVELTLKWIVPYMDKKETIIKNLQVA